MGDDDTEAMDDPSPAPNADRSPVPNRDPLPASNADLSPVPNRDLSTAPKSSLPAEPGPEASLAAVILAGGRGSRLGGIRKPLARLGSSTLLELAIRAVPVTSTVVVVGPADLADELPDLPDTVRWVCEDPPFGGPVAALVAGLAAVPRAAQWVLLLAADQPTVHASVNTLLGASPDVDGSIGVDADQRPQPLAALYRVEALRELLRSNSFRRLMDIVDRLRLKQVRLDDRLDVDTPQDAQYFGVRF